MTLHKIQLAAIAPQPWRNGGGRTRELLRWPRRDDWQVRISVADTDSDGPFSAWPGTERWFAVIDGHGVRLALPTGEEQVTAQSAPLRFDGACAPDCRLIDGPTRDLNLMLQHARGSMSVVKGSWNEAFAWRALFSSANGMWTDGRDRWPIGAGTLMWSDDAAATPWHFDATGPGAAWWIGATPLKGAAP